MSLRTPGDTHITVPPSEQEENEIFDTLSAEAALEPDKDTPPAWRRSDRLLLALALVLIAATVLLSSGEVSERFDHLGRAVCGQLSEHSFFCGGRQLPLCARCTGTYLGVLVTYVMLSLMGRGRANKLPPLNILLALFLFIALWALDGLNSYVTLFTQSPLLYEPSNLLRLSSGLLQGLALMVIVRPIVAFTLWGESQEERVVRGYGELAVLVAAVAAVGFVAQSEAPWLYYPLSLSSVAGELLMLSLVNTLVLCVLLRREGAVANWRQAAVLWLAGLAAALVEVNLINVARQAISRLLGLPV
ncbi:MAG: DUF2085 domain-containing protein [Chloroflexi bacterium]|nr:DUF2085 domain-containing protein [Chloroflexota bacterium]